MNLFGLWFQTPWAFVGLLLVPLLVWHMVVKRRYGRVPIPHVRAFDGVPAGWVARLWWLPDALRLVAVLCLVIALARPQTEDRQVVTGEGVDIMVALDMSASMNSVDMSAAELDAVLARGSMPRNRFESARNILESFALTRRQDRVGLVVFGPEAWLKYPLTLDYGRFVETLRALVLDNGHGDPKTGRCMNGCTIGGNGTAIGDALGRSYNRLRRSSAKSRAVVLITDGKWEGGTLDPMAIARHMANLPPGEQVRVYTFLVGSNEQTWLPRYDMRGRLLVDSTGAPAYARPSHPFPVDPELLRGIAEITGGKFYQSYSEAKFRQDIADMERTVFSTEVHVTRSDVFVPLALLALWSLLAEVLLRVTRWRSLV